MSDLLTKSATAQRQERIARCARLAAPAAGGQEFAHWMLESVYDAALTEDLAAPLWERCVAAALSNLQGRLIKEGFAGPAEDLLAKLPSLASVAVGSEGYEFTWEAPLQVQTLAELIADDRLREALGYASEPRSDGWAEGDLTVTLLWQAVHGPGGLAETWRSMSEVDDGNNVEIEHDWLVPGLLATRDRVVLYSQTGVGKSWLLMQFATDIARGVHPITCDNLEGGPRKVLYVDLEMGPEETKRRRLALTDDASPDTLRVRSFQGHGFDVEQTETLADLDLLLAMFKPDLLCIGPVKNMMRAPISGNATSTSTASFKLAELVESWSARGMAVMLEHHTPKSGHGLAGDGTLERSATHTVQLSSQGALRLTKERSHRAWASFGRLEQAAPRGSGNGRWTQKDGAARKAIADDSSSSGKLVNESKSERQERLFQHLQEHAETAGNLKALAYELGIDRSTLRRDRDDLRSDGRWPEPE